MALRQTPQKTPEIGNFSPKIREPKVAVTAGVFSILEPSEALQKEGQDLKGRMWDMLWRRRKEVELSGIEPPTSSLRTRRSPS